MQLQNFGPQQPFTGFPVFQGPVQSSPQAYGGFPTASSFSPFQMMNLMKSLMSSITQLSQGWGGFGGGQPPVQGGGYPVFGGGYPTQGGGFPTFGGGPVVDYASMHFPQSQTYGTGGTSGGYGGGTQTGGGVPLPRPSDPNEFASYLQAQIAGGTLQGGTNVAQNDAIPGTRFGQVQDSTMWRASLARNYAYQFAAYAKGSDPLTPQGLAQGAAAFDQMKPEAQLFMQVASVFKGNLMNGPGSYDNPGLKKLLESKGLNQLANQPQVGLTDVQSIGAIASAIDSGHLTLNEVINSGTISDLNRYQQVIGYVSGGGFAADLQNYDTVRF